MDAPLSRRILKPDFVQLGPVSTDFTSKTGFVNKGLLKGFPVAIKVFRSRTLPPYMIEECDVYSRLSHPGLVTYYGLCAAPGDFAMVFELMPYSLRTFYDKYQLTEANQYYFALQLCSALVYLHSQHIFFHGLHSKNVFITRDYVLKVCDFGLVSTKLDCRSHQEVINTSDHSMNWRAPETTTFGFHRLPKPDLLAARFKLDVYVFGLLVWEMGVGRIPFAHLPGEIAVYNSLASGVLEDIPPLWSDDLKDLIHTCWAVPSQRPTFPALFDRIQSTYLWSEACTQFQLALK